MKSLKQKYMSGGKAGYCIWPLTQHLIVQFHSVAQSCLALYYDPMDCSPPGSSVHEIFQATILEWVTIFFPSESSWPRDWTCICSLHWQANSLPLCHLEKPRVVTKAVLRGKIILIIAYLRKQEKYKVSYLNLYLKEVEKEQTRHRISIREKIIKTGAEINED